MALFVVQIGGVGFSQVQDIQHGLLGQELEAADALFVVGVEFQFTERLVGFDGGFALLEEFEFAIEFGILDLLAIFVEAF